MEYSLRELKRMENDFERLKKFVFELSKNGTVLPDDIKTMMPIEFFLGGATGCCFTGGGVDYHERKISQIIDKYEKRIDSLFDVIEQLKQRDY